MKKFLFVMMAMCLTFAMISCETEPEDKDITISFDLNLPVGATGATAPAPKTGAPPLSLTSAEMLSAIEGYEFGGWYTSKANAESGTAPVGTRTPLSSSITLYARWIVSLGFDQSGVVEKITLNNGAYAIFEFKLPAGKKWSDYKNISVDYLADNGDVLDQQARRIAIMGNYKVPDDFGFFEYPEDGPAAGAKKAYASFSNTDALNKNAQYMLNISDDNKTVSELLGEYGDGIELKEWATLNYVDIADWTPHGSFVAGNLPAADATGPFYIGLGLSTGSGSTDLTLYMRNVTLVSKDGTADVTATPAIFKVGNDLFPAFCGWSDFPNAGNGVPNVKRESVGTETAEPITVTVADNSVDITFDYNYPAGTLAAKTETKTTDTDGRLIGLLGDPASADIPNMWKFLGWFTEATAGTKVTEVQQFAAAATIYAQWEEVVLVAPSRALVIDNPNVVAQGNNMTLDQGGKTWNVMATATWATAHGGGNYGSLSTYAFPDEYGLFLYDRIVIYYETAEHATDYVSGSKDVIVKSGFGEWSTDYAPGTPAVGNTYPTLTSGTLVLDPRNLQKVNGTAINGGFSLQLNNNGQAGNGKADGWLVRFTKIEFTTQALIDAGPATGPEVFILGQNDERGSIELLPGNIIRVANVTTRSNIGFGVALPAGWTGMTTLNVEYTITFDASAVDAATGKLAKFTTKVGKAINVDTNPASYSADVTTDGDGILATPVARLKNAEGAWLGTIETDNTLSFQINTWGDAGAALPMKFDIVVTGVGLVP